MEILSLGEKIKRKRKELDLTLKDLAANRITPGQISLVESGKSNPSMDLLEYIAASLNTSMEYLMESEETQAEKICAYFEATAEFHILNGDKNLGEQFIEKVLFYANEYNLEYRKARSLYLKGCIYIENDDISQAQHLLLSANNIFIKKNCYADIVSTFIKLGEISFNSGAYHSSVSFFKQSEKIFIDHKIGEDLLLGNIYFHIANSYLKLDNTDKSMKYSFLANQIFAQIGNKKAYAKSLFLMAEEYYKKSDIENCIKYSKNALKVFREVKDQELISEIENDLGKLFSEFENIEESFIHLKKAKEIREKSKDRKLMDTLIIICENYIKLKEINKAEQALEEVSDNLTGEDNDTLLEYHILKHRIELLRGRATHSVNTLMDALKYAENFGNLNKAAEISIMIGKIYMDNGKDKEAARHLNLGVEYFKQKGVLK